MTDRRFRPGESVGHDEVRTGRPGEDGGIRVRLGAKALCRSTDGVLLVRERRRDGSTFWTLPGGGLEPGESVADCLRRELDEELDCRLHVQRFVTTCSYRHRSLDRTVTRYVVCACRLAGDPTPDEREGIIDYEWASPADPPAGTLGPFRRLLVDTGTPTLNISPVDTCNPSTTRARRR